MSAFPYRGGTKEPLAALRAFVKSFRDVTCKARTVIPASRARLRHQLAQRLRALRKARGWTQEDLADASGLHRTYVSLIERARCNASLDSLAQLAAALGIAAAELLGERRV